MKKLLLPVTLFGWYLLVLGIGGFAGHYYLLPFPQYSTMAQVAVIVLSMLNVSLGLFFIFLRRILSLAVKLLLYFLFRKMATAASESMRRFHDQLLNIKTNLD
ncbi:MAG: hypothetical protein HZA04_06800 [Nitrospinae bacterium]|nr:hypothetical protein [Nitrospinota bacterium]